MSNVSNLVARFPRIGASRNGGLRLGIIAIAAAAIAIGALPALPAAALIRETRELQESQENHDGSSDGPIDFQRQVLPILGDHCFTCHGFDPASRQSGLRLDLFESALQGGDSGLPAVVPGDPDASELWARISSDEPGLRMPPEEFPALTDQQIETLRQWIAEGGQYADHWAFQSPRRQTLPAVRWPDSQAQPDTLSADQGDETTGHPIDAWVAAALQQRGLTPSPPAPDWMLARRLYLDLVGLPPSPEQLQRFRQIGYEATVDELLEQPQFGEKWARHWLDAARYSDTNGYEKDLRREQWIWRDWVIDSLNRDQPYDDFLIEQIAGDLLPDAGQEQIIATGFLRNSMLNEEGAIVAEEFRMAEMFDRLDCLGKAVMGLTTQCAQCHSHKFDPLTHEEYFGLFAFLNNSYEAQSPVYTQQQQASRQEVLEAIAGIDREIQQQRPDWQAELAGWLDQLRPESEHWEPVRMDDLGSVSGLNHPVQLDDQSILMLGHTSEDVYFLATPDLQGVTGLRLEALPHGDLPFGGPGRGPEGTWGVLELETWTRRPGEEWVQQALTEATADWSQPEQSHQDGKRKSGPVALLIDGSDANWWQADRGRGRRNQASAAVVRFADPLEMEAGTQLKVVLRMNQMLGCCRISLSKEPQPRAPNADHAAVLLAHALADRHAIETAGDGDSAQQRRQTTAFVVDSTSEDETLGPPEPAVLWADLSPDQQATAFAAWRSRQPELAPQQAEIDQWWAKFPDAQTSVLHLRQREPQMARTTHLLDRGQWDRPMQKVAPHTPAFLHPLEPHENEAPRLQFARWLASPQSPLTARVAVNQIWQAMFGTGLVSTPEDFGTRAPVPVHLELLDWLAVDFMESGWSRKHLIRTIVTSQTYRQDSRAASESWERDPDNQFLGRGPRFRADAEVVRDVALTAAGLLNLKMGGPSVIPPVPQNVLDYNYVYPDYWKAAEGPERYRRTVYGFRKRSMPDPATGNFDAPNADTSCVRRVRSNTPLAALTGLNEAIFVEAARGLALRILQEGGADDSQRIAYGFLLCLGRAPSEAEIQEVHRLLAGQRQRLADGWLDPRLVAFGQHELPELPPGTTPQDAAAWTLVGRVLLNLDETLNKN